MSRLVVAIGHVEFTGGSQVLYVVKVQQDADEWEVRRTYSDFRKLRDDVHRVMKDARAHILDDACSREFARELADMHFPSKRLFGSKKDHVVKERAVELHRFLIKLLFLTHTYRKAQKARYDQYVDAVSAHQQAAYAALQNRTQASVTVFYLLRDFLKPNTMKTGMSTHAGDLLGSSSGAVSNASSATAGSGVAGAADDDDDDDSPRRLIRESKILAMRHSGASSQGKKKNKSASSAPNLLHEADAPRHERSQQQLTHSQSTEHARSRSVAKMTTTKATESDDPDAVTQPEEEESTAPSASRSKTLSITSLMEASARSRAEANSLREQYMHKQPDEPTVPEDTALVFNKQRHYSTPNGDAGEWRGRTNRAVTSASAMNSTSSAQSELVASSVVSSASSSASTEDVVLVDLTLLANASKDKEASKKPRSHRSTSHASDKPQASSRSRSRAKKGVRRKAASAKDLHLREEERLSRLSTQLTAQTISVNAQRELEKYLSEYSAIMILRYVDRFISKAVTRAPGCYRVNAQHRLVIDSERFLEELESTFTDLPDNFATMFHDAGAGVGPGEWGFPKALDRYVQMKWNSFQGKNVGGSSVTSGGSVASRSSLVDHRTSGSEDDSDTDYEYEETGGGGYMRSKTTFSNDEESMLQEMIANGTAGREQMLRLRRQLHESGWNRRENPGTRSQRVVEEEEDDDSSDSDDDASERRRLQERQKRRSKRLEAQKSASCVVERYQQEQNARRKDRLNHAPSIGGLV